MRRRGFLASTLATLAAPAWAALDGARLLSAAADPAGRTWIIGLSAEGHEVFRLPVPGRGHAAAAHPRRAEAVAFARRPGNFAIVIDCVSGREVARLHSPEGHHFYGHGAFTVDGSVLLTTENAFDVPEGRIGMWDATDGYRRIGDRPSGGLGPHEIIRLKDGVFAVANGGIQTHPDFGRRKLNIPQMRTNLAYLSPEGQVVDVVEPAEELRQNSIRHIAADISNRVSIATQWQGEPSRLVPLVATHHRGEGIAFHDHPNTGRLRHYAGSIATSVDGDTIAVTGPKGDTVLLFAGDGDVVGDRLHIPTAAGVAAVGSSFVVTSEQGLTWLTPKGTVVQARTDELVWDNHLVVI